MQKGATLDEWGGGGAVGADCFLLAHKASSYIDTPSILKCLLNKEREWPAAQSCIRDQVLLIMEYAGMQAMISMYAYCCQPSTEAIMISSVANQALEFKKLYEEIKAAFEVDHAGLWPYGRSLAEDKLAPLANSKFPDLYQSVILGAKKRGDLNPAYTMSAHKTTASRDTLTRRANRSLSVSSTTTADLKRTWTALGRSAEDLTKIGEKKRRRRRDPVSSSSDSD